MMYSVYGIDTEIPDHWTKAQKQILINSALRKAEFAKNNSTAFNDPMAMRVVKALYPVTKDRKLTDGQYRAEIVSIMELWNNTPWEYLMSNISFLQTYPNMNRGLMVDPKEKFQALKNQYIQKTTPSFSPSLAISRQIAPPTGKGIPTRVVMSGFGALDESLYLPPDNVEWMIPEYQSLSPNPSITDLGADTSLAPSYISDTVNNAVAPVVTSQTDTTTSQMSNGKKMAMVGAGLTALFLAMK